MVVEEVKEVLESDEVSLETVKEIWTLCSKTLEENFGLLDLQDALEVTRRLDGLLSASDEALDGLHPLEESEPEGHPMPRQPYHNDYEEKTKLF